MNKDKLNFNILKLWSLLHAPKESLLSLESSSLGLHRRRLIVNVGHKLQFLLRKNELPSPKEQSGAFQKAHCRTQ